MSTFYSPVSLPYRTFSYFFPSLSVCHTHTHTHDWSFVKMMILQAQSSVAETSHDRAVDLSSCVHTHTYVHIEFSNTAVHRQGGDVILSAAAPAE